MRLLSLPISVYDLHHTRPCTIVCIAYNAVVMWPIQTADYNIQIFQSPYLYVYSCSCASSLHAFSMKTPTISNLEHTSRRFTGYSMQTYFTFDLPSSKLWRDCRQIRVLSSINLGYAINRRLLVTLLCWLNGNAITRLIKLSYLLSLFG